VHFDTCSLNTKWESRWLQQPVVGMGANVTFREVQYTVATIKNIYAANEEVKTVEFAYEQALHPASRNVRVGFVGLRCLSAVDGRKDCCPAYRGLGGQQKIAAIHSIIFRLRYREGDFVMPDGYMAKMRPYYKTLGEPKNWLNALR